VYVDITVVSVLITFVRVKITLHVKITLITVLTSHYACQHHTMRLPDLVSGVTVSGIFSDSRSAYIVSFFSDFMSAGIVSFFSDLMSVFKK
jgi:hypothetical protein